MDNAWMHDPSRRPNFTQLKVLLDNAKPLIYDVVKPTKPKDETRGRLKLEAGQSVTLLDRFYDKQAQGMWKGCVNETGKVGLFHPSHTTLQHEGGGTRKPSFSSASSSGSVTNSIIFCNDKKIKNHSKSYKHTLKVCVSCS